MEAVTHTKSNPPWTRAHPISVAVEPVALVVTECITVTSAMRKHARWAHSSVSAILGGSAPSRLEILKAPPPTRKLSAPRKENGTAQAPRPAQGLSDDAGLASRWGLRGKKGQSMQDNPLLSAFAKLRNDLKQCKGAKFCISDMRDRRLTKPRYPYRRRACHSSSLPPDHPLLVHLRSYHVSRAHCNHQVLLLWHYKPPITATSSSHAAPIFRCHPLQIRS